MPVVLLSLSSLFLYAGGVAFNDVCDAELDAVERPERPIPSGRVSKKQAALFSMILFVTGIASAILTGPWSGSLAFLIAVSCVTYDRWAKPHVFFGPLNMGICRGLNLLLGMSVLPLMMEMTSLWPAVIPVLYIAAITLISRGEVHGGKRSSILTALLFYVLVVIAIAVIGALTHRMFVTVFFLALFAAFIFPPLFRALRSPSGPLIGKAVKAGVLGLILMNAAWAAAGGGWVWAIATALLLPLSLSIADRFAVT